MPDEAKEGGAEGFLSAARKSRLYVPPRLPPVPCPGLSESFIPFFKKICQWGKKKGLTENSCFLKIALLLKNLLHKSIFLARQKIRQMFLKPESSSLLASW